MRPERRRRIRARADTMSRLLTAAVLAPLLWALIKLAPPPVFSAVAIAAILLACHECYRILEKRGARPFTPLGLVFAGGIAASFSTLAPSLDVVLPLVGAAAATILAAMVWRSEPPAMLDAVLATWFPLVFVALTMGHVVRLRSMPGDDGADVLLLLFLCVIASDTCALYAGRAFGRHKMAPRLSPGKTWEGGAAGFAGSILGAIVAHVWFYQRLPLEHALVLGVVLGLAGPFGDLSVSMVKRAGNVKDSSNLLPGHGGLLDRIDSLLFAGPLLYYYYRVFLGGGP
jgi:phosphatidate cytidylyltransferase